MGLLSGALQGLGAGVAQVGIESMKENAAEEAARAQALREYNLRMLMEDRQDSRDDKKNSQEEARYTRDQADKGSGLFDPETGVEIKNKDLNEYDKDKLVGKHLSDQKHSINPDIRLNGLPATNAELEEASSNKRDAEKNIGLVQQAINDRVSPDIDALKTSGNLMRKNKVDAVYNDKGKPTADEQEIVDSWKDDFNTNIGSDKKDREMAAIESKQAIQAMSLDFNQKKLDIQAQHLRDLAEHYRAKDSKETGRKVNEIEQQIKLNAEMRKEGNAAASLLKQVGNDVSAMNPAMYKLYKSHLSRAGLDEGDELPDFIKNNGDIFAGESSPVAKSAPSGKRDWSKYE